MAAEDRVSVAGRVVDNNSLGQELLDSAWGRKHEQLTLATVKGVWAGLSDFVRRNLLIGKNVSVPFLGSFLVCKALDTATGQKMSLVRPFFELLAGRFAAVPKHIGKHAPSTGGAACQPSYVAIAKAASVHRVLAAQVVKELSVRLGVRLKSRTTLNVAFPGVGTLLTDSRGRVAFRFDAELMESIRKKQGGDDSGNRVKARRDDEPRPSTPLSAAVHHLKRLCREADHTKSGCVPRLMLEDWLFEHCRPALLLVDAGSVFDMLSLHTFGRSGKLVQYGTFLEAFTHAIQGARGVEGRPHAPLVRDLLPEPSTADSAGPRPPPRASEAPPRPDPRAGHTVQILSIQDGPGGIRVEREREELSPPPARPPAASIPGMGPAPRDAAPAPKVPADAPSAPGRGPVPTAVAAKAPAAVPEAARPAPPTAPEPVRASAPLPSHVAPAAALAGPPQPIRPPTSGPRFAWMDEEPITHPDAPVLAPGLDYFDPWSSRGVSRADCDAFNKAHFDRLYHARGWSSARMISSRTKDGIASDVTPKVGQDPLMRRAWDAARASHEFRRPDTAAVLDEQVRQKNETRAVMRALDTEEARARVTADQAARDAARAQEAEAKAERMAALRRSWEEQMRERNAARQRLIDVEGQWPFVIPHQPLEKLPLQIQPHYIGVPIKV